MKDPTTGRTSDSRTVGIGVLQEFVLDALLFTLYITDFQGVLNHYNLCRDDLQINLHCGPNDLQAGIPRINSDIDRLVN